MLPSNTDALSRMLASAGISQQQLSQAVLQDPALLERLKNTFNVENRESDSSSDVADQLFQRLQQIRASHAQERNLPCVKVPPKKRKDAMLGFEIYDDSVSVGYNMRQTIIGMGWSFSRSKLEDLRRVSLQDMFARKTHKGRYFMGRVVSGVSKLISISFFLEDPEGHAVMVSIYNYPTTFYHKADIESIFSQGTVWAIREPTYKFPVSGQNPMIRIDSPSDILPIAPDDEIMRSVRWSGGLTPQVPRTLASVEDYRLKGAREFKAQKFLSAAICYTEGLKLDETSVIMRLNRSEAYIRLGWYNSALLDADSVIQDGLEDASLLRKAVYRAAKSSYLLQKYRRAIDYAQQLPDDKDCADLITRSKKRLHEKETGEFDWCALFRDSQTEAYRPDVADFIGPVEVKKIGSNSYRGLFATRDIKIGELLLATKPLASYYEEDTPINQRGHFFSLNLLTNEVVKDRGRPAIISILAQKMWDDERLSSRIKCMYAGPEGSPPEQYDAQEEVISSGLNHPLVSRVNIDISRLEGVSSFNAFTLNGLVSRNQTPGKPEESGSALYGLASFCNHSCLPSVRRSFYGDFIVLRATRPIMKGEELTIEYIAGNAQLHVREKLSRWNFTCDCILCKADRADGAANLSLREQLLIEIDPEKSSPQAAARKLSKIKQSYKDTSERRACGTKPMLSVAYNKYALTLIGQAKTGGSDYTRAIEAQMDCLEAIGMKISDRSISGPFNARELPVDLTCGPTHRPLSCTIIVLQIVSLFDKLREIDRAMSWMKVASWTHDIEVGGGSELFKLGCATMLETMGLSNIAAQAL